MTPELAWAELRKNDPRLPQFEEMTVPEVLDPRMLAQVRPKTVRITIRIATTRCYERPAEILNMKSPEEMRDEMVSSHRSRSEAIDYQVEDLTKE
jgi:hypothetical protein